MKYLLAFAAALFLIAPGSLKAEAQFQAQVEGITITVYNEPCTIKEVANLPYRATWLQDGKMHEGCFSYAPHVESLMMYFETDRSVAVVPVKFFKKLQGV